jgi:hypothetical protein
MTSEEHAIIRAALNALMEDLREGYATRAKTMAAIDLQNMLLDDKEEAKPETHNGYTRISVGVLGPLERLKEAAKAYTAGKVGSVSTENFDKLKRACDFCYD